MPVGTPSKDPNAATRKEVRRFQAERDLDLILSLIQGTDLAYCDIAASGPEKLLAAVAKAEENSDPLDPQAFGFECHIDRYRALRWMEENRPLILDEASQNLVNTHEGDLPDLVAADFFHEKITTLPDLVEAIDGDHAWINEWFHCTVASIDKDGVEAKLEFLVDQFGASALATEVMDRFDLDLQLTEDDDEEINGATAPSMQAVIREIATNLGGETSINPYDYLDAQEPTFAFDALKQYVRSQCSDDALADFLSELN